MKISQSEVFRRRELLIERLKQKRRYGFIYVDRTEQDEKGLTRYKKNSFYWYKKLIETNQLPS